MANIEPGYKTDKLGCFDLTQCNTYRLVDKDGTERFTRQPLPDMKKP